MAGKHTKELQNLESHVKEYEIFIDTCSLLLPIAGKFWQRLTPFLKLHSKIVIAPVRCFEELERIAKDKKRNAPANDAKAALKRLHSLHNSQFIDFRGGKSYGTADNVFLIEFVKKRATKCLMLITQDYNLAADILSFNSIRSVEGKKILVRRINSVGFLSRFDFDLDEATEQAENGNVDTSELCEIPKPVLTESFMAARAANSLVVQHEDQVTSACFSPCGQYVVSGSDDMTTRVTELASGQVVLEVQHGGRVTDVCFSPCGKYVMSRGNDNTVRVTRMPEAK